MDGFDMIRLRHARRPPVLLALLVATAYDSIRALSPVLPAKFRSRWLHVSRESESLAMQRMDFPCWQLPLVPGFWQ